MACDVAYRSRYRRIGSRLRAASVNASVRAAADATTAKAVETLS